MIKDMLKSMEDIEEHLGVLKPFETFVKEQELKDSKNVKDRVKSINPTKFENSMTAYDAAHSIGQSSGDAIRFGFKHDMWASEGKKTLEEKYEEYVAYETKRIMDVKMG